MCHVLCVSGYSGFPLVGLNSLFFTEHLVRIAVTCMKMSKCAQIFETYGPYLELLLGEAESGCPCRGKYVTRSGFEILKLLCHFQFCSPCFVLEVHNMCSLPSASYAMPGT